MRRASDAGRPHLRDALAWRLRRRGRGAGLQPARAPRAAPSSASRPCCRRSRTRSTSSPAAIPTEPPGAPLSGKTRTCFNFRRDRVNRPTTSEPSGYGCKSRPAVRRSDTRREPASPRPPAVGLTRCESGADGESPDGRGRRGAAVRAPRRPRARRPAPEGCDGEPQWPGRRRASERRRELMAQAVALGEHGRRTAPPNPWVGCVSSTGRRDRRARVPRRPGEPHAEIAALRARASRARAPPCT